MECLIILIYLNMKDQIAIENYNRRIKLKLSKYLYGKNRCKITWPLFIFFIKNEESDFQKEYHDMENKLEEKGWNKPHKKFKLESNSDKKKIY